MIKWLSNMESGSDNHLVVCSMGCPRFLGDWCPPSQKSMTSGADVFIPSPFVNTYFYIKSLYRVSKIEKVLGISKNVDKHLELIENKLNALNREYYNKETGDYADNLQGANVFAVDIGLDDDKRTFENIVKHYNEDCQFDTGIFETDILIRVLLQRHEYELAYKLLSSKKRCSFHNWMKNGETTFIENCNGVRSHCHPMFGVVTRYLIEYILGIRQTEDSVVYSDVIINPVMHNFIHEAEGKITTVYGDISVKYDDNRITVNIPKEINAYICIDDFKEKLRSVTTTYMLPIC